ncbi:hypothetical protein L916_13700, partial [Phytophthora nicotianae]
CITIATHDFWHTLFNVPPTVLGEIALKYVEMAHSKLPVSALSAFEYVLWANRAPKNSHSLHCVMYEEEFEPTCVSKIDDDST